MCTRKSIENMFRPRIHEEDGRTLVLLLCGGDKSTQRRLGRPAGRLYFS